MISTRTPRFRTQPRIPPHLVEMMDQLRMTRELARSRVLRSLGAGWPPGPPDRLWFVTVGAELTGKPLSIQVAPSRQRLRGQRWWWVCPECGRKCGVLLSPARCQLPFRCRRCWHAVYVTNYSTRHPGLVEAMRSTRQRLLEQLRSDLDQLTAPRRKGIRRGRRVKQRAARLRGKILLEERREAADSSMA